MVNDSRDFVGVVSLFTGFLISLMVGADDSSLRIASARAKILGLRVLLSKLSTDDFDSLLEKNDG